MTKINVRFYFKVVFMSILVKSCLNILDFNDRPEPENLAPFNDVAKPQDLLLCYECEKCSEDETPNISSLIGCKSCTV